MAKLMIVCPKTGKAVSTGVSETEDSVETATLSNCPECGEEHVWTGKAAFLDEEES